MIIYQNENFLYFAGVVVFFGLLFLIRLAAKNLAYKNVSLAMLSVEKQLSTWAKNQYTTGFEKRATAIQLIVSVVYPKLPLWASVFITEKMLINAIEVLYKEMLDFLDDGTFNDSI